MDIMTLVKILVIVIGIIVSVQVLTSISTSPLGNCDGQDYNGDGVIGSSANVTAGNQTATALNTDSLTAGYKTCSSAISSGFNIFQIAASLIILLVIPIIFMFLNSRRE